MQKSHAIGSIEFYDFGKGLRLFATPLAECSILEARSSPCAIHDWAQSSAPASLGNSLHAIAHRIPFTSRDEVQHVGNPLTNPSVGTYGTTKRMLFVLSTIR